MRMFVDAKAVYLYPKTVDFRQQFNGLALIVEQQLDVPLMSGALFVFTNPSKLNNIVAFFPSHGTKRVTAQSGMFTIHPTKSMKLESETIKKILIPATKKKYFLEKLVKYGIHQGTIFPDLDGLSNYIRYLNDYR